MTLSAQSRLHRVGRALTVALTTAIKLVGLAAAFKGLFLDQNPRPVVLAVAAFMMAGAQLTEETVLGLLEKLLDWGVQTEEKRSGGRPDGERRR
jgi:hypothetical protein